MTPNGHHKHSMRRKTWPRLLSLGLAVGLTAAGLVGCADKRVDSQAVELDSSVAVRWFELLYDVVRAERLSPPVASRVYGHAALALYEAVRPARSDFASLGGQVAGLGAAPALPPGAPPDWPSAANGAIAGVVRALLPNASAGSRAALDALELDLQRQRQAIVGTSVMETSVRYGRAVADVVVARAAQDGFAQWNNCAETVPTGESFWERTPPAFAAPLQPCWGRLQPMALPSAETCAIAPGSPFSSNPGSRFYGQMLEVYSTVNGLTAEQLAIANFWADNPGATGTPPGHWIAVLAQFVSEHDLKLDTAAEAFARVGIAVNDAFINCWRSKFTNYTLRPVTYIRRYIDPNWPLTPVGTPPFPDYPSGHSVQSGAASEVLTAMFGAVPFNDASHVDDLGLQPKSFPNWAIAADEAAISRLYGGIHYRDSIDLGVEQGRCIGREIGSRMKFRR